MIGLDGGRRLGFEVGFLFVVVGVEVYRVFVWSEYLIEIWWLLG